MRRSTTWAILLAAMPFGAAVLRGEILDRIAVTVGRHAITEGDVMLDLRLSAFLDRREVDTSASARRASAMRLADQYLMLEEAGPSREALAVTGDAESMTATVRRTYPDEDQYTEALKAYAVTEAQLVDHLLNGLRSLRFAEARFSREGDLSDADLDGWLVRARAAAPVRMKEAVFGGESK